MSQRFKFRVVLYSILLIECASILFIGNKVFSQRNKLKNILGESVVVPMRKDTLQFSGEQEFAHYYEPKPNSTITEHPDWLGYTVTSTINADTLNEATDYSVKKTDNTVRIIALGESYTFGEYVNTQEAWPKQLEHMLNTTCQNSKKYEVLNLGVAGYDVDYIAHRYETRGKKYSPDLIIWLESGTGFNRTRELMSSYIDRYQLTEEQKEGYKSRGDYYPEWSLALADIRKDYTESAIEHLIRSWWERFLQVRGTVPVIITTFPNEAAMKMLYSWTKGQSSVFIARISDIFIEDGVLADTHPNPKGHTMIAKDTFEYLIDSKLIDCH